MASEQRKQCNHLTVPDCRLLASPVKLSSQQQQELAGSVLRASVERLGSGKGHGLELADAFRLLCQLATQDLLSKRADSGDFAAGVIAALLVRLRKQRDGPHIDISKGLFGTQAPLACMLLPKLAGGGTCGHEGSADCAPCSSVPDIMCKQKILIWDPSCCSARLGNWQSTMGRRASTWYSAWRWQGRLVQLQRTLMRKRPMWLQQVRPCAQHLAGCMTVGHRGTLHLLPYLCSFMCPHVPWTHLCTI